MSRRELRGAQAPELRVRSLSRAERGVTDEEVTRSGGGTSASATRHCRHCGAQVPGGFLAMIWSLARDSAPTFSFENRFSHASYASFAFAQSCIIM